MLLKSIRNHFSEDEVCIISQDNYYKPEHFQARDENGVINFDLPEGIDEARFLEDIARLTTGKSIEMEEYMFNQPGVKGDIITLKPAPVVVVEGIFIFHFPEISKIIDLKIYLDSPEELKLARRLARDKKERGLEDDIIHYQWHNHAVPSFNTYLLPHKEGADLVINNLESFEEGLDVLRIRIMEILNISSLD
jgi:uridine kinase